MKLPLIADVDTLVIGATVPGVAVAETSCAAGRKTLLIERNTYCASEMGVWHRPFFSVAAGCDELMEKYFPTPSKYGDTLSFVPDEFKRKMEDVLLKAGCQILYGCSHVFADYSAGWRVVIANRSGMQLLRAGQLVYATEEWPRGAEDVIRVVAELRGVTEIPTISEGDGSPLRNTRWVRGATGENLLMDVALPAGGDRFDAYETVYQLFASLKRERRLPPDAAIGLLSARPMPYDAYHPLTAAKEALRVWHSNPDAACLRLTGEHAAPAADIEGTAPAGRLFSENELGRYYEFPVEDVRLTADSASAETDVLVIGGGTSGVMAAYAAASEGARVCLADMHDTLGGTSTVGGVHYYWFGSRRGFTRLLDDRYFAYAGLIGQPPIAYVWGLRDGWNPSIRSHVLCSMLREKNTDLSLNSICVGVFRDDRRVTGALFATASGLRAVRARITVDATGDGDAAAFAGADYTYGGRNRFTMWSSLAQYKDAGLYKGGVFTTNADIGDVFDCTRYLLVNRRRGPEGLYDHGTYLTTRESRHIAGDYTVTYPDVLLCKRYVDTVQVGYSNHDPKGISDSDAIYAGSLPSQQMFHMPYRAFLPKDLEGLYVTGKAVSATHDAMPIIRMQDDVQEQGGAVGIAAALCAREDLPIRDMPLRLLQEKLITVGTLSWADLSPPEQVAAIAAQVETLTGGERFAIWDLDKNEELTQPLPIWRILMARAEEAVPALLARLSAADGKLSLLISRLLLWHGAREGLPGVTDAVRAALNGTTGLPVRTGSFQWSQLYPDQGHMAEICYDTVLLSRVDGRHMPPILEELTGRIERAARDYTDKAQCVFGYIDSIARVAAQRPRGEYIPLLERLLDLPEIASESVVRADDLDISLLRERMAMLRFLLGRAIARCGGKRGYYSLAEQTADLRKIIAKTAADTLKTLTGQWHGLNTRKWREAIRQIPGSLPIIPEEYNII